ncbi:MAG: flagellar basal body-associated FliL family protein [Pseudomonadota bacterium]
MSAEADVEEDAPKKGSKLPLILGVVLALAGGGGGFYAVQAGLIGGGDTADESTAKAEAPVAPPLVAASFVPIDPLVISLPKSGGRDHLRFSAQLEVPPSYVAEVEAIKPRIVDVLNSYLRAVELTELEDPAALMRLRAQMLRRVQVVAGNERVNDLLIMEFVLS